MLALQTTQGWDWEGIATRWGLPLVFLIAVLVVIGLVLRGAWKWAKPHVERLIASHIGLLDDTRETVRDLKITLEGMASTLADLRTASRTESVTADERTRAAVNQVLSQMRDSSERTVKLLESLQSEQRLRFDLLARLVGEREPPPPSGGDPRK